MNWDWLIGAVIVIWLFLIIAARMTNQSIPELLSGMKDFILGTKEDVVERGEDLLYYE